MGLVTLTDALREYWAGRPMEVAAALSYYTLLSLAPLVLMAVSLAGLVVERAAVEGRIVAEMRDLIGHEGADVAEAVLRNAGNREKGAASVGIGMLILLVGATTVFVELQDALNRIWKVDADSWRGVVSSFVKSRLLSLAVVMGIGFLLLVSLLLHAALAALRESARGALGDASGALDGLASLVSLGISTLLFATIFKVLPDAEVRWREVWVGAAATALLFTLGKALIGLYLGHAAIGSAYGAAGSLVVVTVWVYYASLIVLLGAQLTYTASRHSRGDMPPEPSAVPGGR